MVAGWLGADYLSAKWIADGYLRKQEYTPTPGAWANEGYLTKRWVSQSWLHRDVAVATSAVTQLNVPGLALAKLDGSAKLILRVNATQPALPIVAFDTVVGTDVHVAAENLLSVPLVVFDTTINGSVSQIGDIDFTIEVESVFGYSKVVAQQNVPGTALAAIDAIVTTGADVNVAATSVSVPLAVFLADAKANTQAAAVASLPVPLGVFDVVVAEGLAVDVIAGFSIPLDAIDVAVTGVTSEDTGVVQLDTVGLELDEFDATIVAISVPEPTHAPGSNRRRLIRRYRGPSQRVSRDGW